MDPDKNEPEGHSTRGNQADLVVPVGGGSDTPHGRTHELDSGLSGPLDKGPVPGGDLPRDIPMTSEKGLSRLPERGRDAEICLSRLPERGRDHVLDTARHPERGRGIDLAESRHPERGRESERSWSRLPERGRDVEYYGLSCHPERGHDFESDLSRHPNRGREFGHGSAHSEHFFPPQPRRFPSVPHGYYDYGETPQSQGSFSSSQLAYLDRMQNQQMQSFKAMLQDTLGSSKRHRSRSRSSSRKRRRSPSTSEDQEEDSDSESEDPGESPLSNTNTPSRKDVDAVSLHAGESNFGDVQKEIDKSAEKEETSGPSEVQDPEGGKKEDKGLALPNPHEVKKGHIFKEDLLEWWEQQRTNVLSQDQIDQLVGDLKPDSSIEKYFRAPNLPPTLKKNVRKVKAEVAKNDNTLWSIQENILQASLPLLQEMEAAKKCWK